MLLGKEPGEKFAPYFRDVKEPFGKFRVN